MTDMDRRSLLKAGAWAAPAILLATAVPAAAASVTPCECRTYSYDPKRYKPGDSMSPDFNVAKITVITGTAVIIRFVKDYPNATALNINGKIVKKWDRGVRKGTEFTAPLEKCTDPTFIQVDGNNTHYYGNGRFA